MPVATSPVRRMSSAMRPYPSMASSGRSPTPAVSAATPGALVHAVREATQVDRETLALRAGVDVVRVARVETGEEAVSIELLDTLLLVLGHQAVEDQNGMPAAAPRPLGRYDAEQLAAAVAAPPGEQLERALEWNKFAAELAAAGPPDAPSAKE